MARCVAGRGKTKETEPSLLAKQCPTQQIISTVSLGSSWVEKGVRECYRIRLRGVALDQIEL